MTCFLRNVSICVTPVFIVDITFSLSLDASVQACQVILFWLWKCFFWNLFTNKHTTHKVAKCFQTSNSDFSVHKHRWMNMYSIAQWNPFIDDMISCWTWTYRSCGHGFSLLINLALKGMQVVEGSTRKAYKQLMIISEWEVNIFEKRRHNKHQKLHSW